MTDEEWINEWVADEDIDILFGCLGQSERPSRRKLRLFAVACCRSIWEQITDEKGRQAIELAEAFADGGTTIELLSIAHVEMETSFDAAGSDRDRSNTRETTLAQELPALAAVVSEEYLDEVDARDAVDAAIGLAMHTSIPPQFWGTGAGDEAAEQAVQIERPRQVKLLRDVFDNPFRPSPPLSPTVLAWNDGTVRRIAEGIYEERAFDRLPILADALLDASCDNEELLAHCRSAGPHVRGCWAVDLILGKS